MNKPKLILVGAGGHCRSCIDVIEQENKFEIIGMLSALLSVSFKMTKKAF